MQWQHSSYLKTLQIEPCEKHTWAEQQWNNGFTFMVSCAVKSSTSSLCVHATVMLNVFARHNGLGIITCCTSSTLEGERVLHSAVPVWVQLKQLPWQSDKLLNRICGARWIFYLTTISAIPWEFFKQICRFNRYELCSTQRLGLGTASIGKGCLNGKAPCSTHSIHVPARFFPALFTWSACIPGCLRSGLHR